MEKVIYLLWRDGQSSGESFGKQLRTTLADKLLALGARGVQVNVADDASTPGEALRQSNTKPQIEGMLSLWLDSAIQQFRRPFDEVVAVAVPRMAAYLVTESALPRHSPTRRSRAAPPTATDPRSLAGHLA